LSNGGEGSDDDLGRSTAARGSAKSIRDLLLLGVTILAAAAACLGGFDTRSDDRDAAACIGEFDNCVDDLDAGTLDSVSLPTNAVSCWHTIASNAARALAFSARDKELAVVPSLAFFFPDDMVDWNCNFWARMTTIKIMTE
jgi:hypothetical protein